MYATFRRMPTLRSMASTLLLVAQIASVACGGGTTAGSSPTPVAFADTTVIVDLATGARLSPAALQARIAAADIVLLGEQHDNAAIHRARGALLRAHGTRPVAAVFEHFARSATPIARPAEGDSREAWLDKHGFDRTGWRWPLHAALVDAALESATELRGTNLSREALRDVVRKGAAAAPLPQYATGKTHLVV